ncbi:hypothetical protein [Streptomyces malaysiensis]|uniref:hypothetical protein n=1 Tax=Streptomyces malaysiensis TaxID=92644 RepID=UPI00142ECC70|nr:hypothetical protein [Streptomyces malaysiensis]
MSARTGGLVVVGVLARWVIVRILVVWSVSGVGPRVRPAPGLRGLMRADCRTVSARTGGLACWCGG